MQPRLTATVVVPAKDASAVTEGGKPAAEAAGVRVVKTEAGSVGFEVESGRYRFESK